MSDLQGGVDHGLCLISIKLESAVFFDFNGAASITTSGVYLRKVSARSTCRLPWQCL